MKAVRMILTACCFWWLQGAAIDPKNVVILVNHSDHESIELGYYYALKRDVPIENIVHLDLPPDENISWDVYLEKLYNPLMTWLLEANWMDGFGSKRKDAVGRQIALIESHKIEALVICIGVPLRIQNDPDRLPAKDAYPKEKLQFYTNRSSVDSELALLPFPKAAIDGFYANPIFSRTEPRNLFDLKPLVIGRLDGPSYESATALIDNAILAESEGIAGRAYVDIKGPHEAGDKWLEDTVDKFNANGYDVEANREEERFNLVDRFDEPLFYFGWYSSAIDGPFTHYDFKFPVGAIALHIHSYSASTIRTGSKYWLGPFVARGVTATFGNTSEPYLGLTHQPHLIMDALFKGMSTGEAALYSIAGLSWMGVFIGDPLYQPPLGLKMSPKNEYDILRTANKARKAGDKSAYKAVLFQHAESQHFSTGLWLYEYYLELDDREKAYDFLSSINQPSSDETRNWGILLDIAEGFFELGHPKKAEALFENLLKRTQSKRQLKLQLLKRGVQSAEKYQQAEMLSSWNKELEMLTKPAEDSAKQKNN
ncbi:MAG: TIGR03790 family protein [Verrucomicrobia bacterium]|nr:TIGR03790 family protein [Verrucomicrobiota bacterium]MDA1066786.1 TIGR03790 family protein [Verrucomicrobiota bacterium]